MTSTNPSTGAGALKGGHVLMALLCFFAVVIAVNATFIVLAVRTFPGEDERRSYLQGLHFNQTLTMRAEQARLGWNADAMMTQGAAGAVAIAEFRDTALQPVTGLTITGRLRRPSTTQDDISLAFEETQPGRYEARAGDPADGGWILHGMATRGTERFEFEQRFTWSTHPRS